MMATPRRSKLWTEKGLKVLGKLVQSSRIKEGWGDVRKLALVIEERTGYKVSKSALNDLENGIRTPKYNTVAAVAAAGFICDRLGRPYTEAELSNIASEVLDPSAESVSLPISKSDTITHNDVDFKNGCKMFYLSSNESQRLHFLVMASMKMRGFLTVEQIVESSSVPENIKWEATEALKVIVSRTFYESQRISDPLLSAIACVCCKVDYWRSQIDPKLKGTETYAGDAVELKAALEMPVSEQNRCL